MRQWQSSRTEVDNVCVNLSGKQFAQPDLIHQVKEMLDETGLEPST